MEYISYKLDGNTMTIALKGHIDSANAPEVEREIGEALDREVPEKLILDAQELEYISSAGLRILKKAFMAMRRKGGSLKLKNVNKMVMEVFEVTGFAGLLQFI